MRQQQQIYPCNVVAELAEKLFGDICKLEIESYCGCMHYKSSKYLKIHHHALNAWKPTKIDDESDNQMDLDDEFYLAGFFKGI